MFSSICRDHLFKIIERKIKDQRLFVLLHRMFKGGVLTPLGLVQEDIGIPQESVLSPILSNIYFHELDVFITKNIIARYRKGVKAPMCREYAAATTLSSVEMRLNERAKAELRRAKRREAHRKGLRYTVNTDNEYVRVRYVRYADDFVIGVRGSKGLATKIFKATKFFIQSSLNLKVNAEKSKLIDTYSNKVPFLGMLIHNVNTRNLQVRNSREIENAKRKKSRVLNRIDAMKKKRALELRNEAWDAVKNSIKKQGEPATREDLSAVFKASNSFSELGAVSRRKAYTTLIDNLSAISEIACNEKLARFLELWKGELNNIAASPKGGPKEGKWVSVTKEESINRIQAAILRSTSLKVVAA